MTAPGRKFWFPAKRYGWGWGPPVAWQGWVFLAAWLAALVAAARLLVHHHPGLYGLAVVALVVVLFAVCFAKGEPPRWRWGDRDRS